MLQPTEDTRIGLSYRSKIRQTAKGDTDIDNIGPTRQSASFDAKATVDLLRHADPERRAPAERALELLGDISWTGWSSIPALKIRNSGTGAKDDELPLNFRDTWRLAVGANSKFAPDWKWKFGLAYDQSPVHKEQDRPTSLPDNDRYWFSTGVQWQATKNTTLDVGYTYLYLRKTYIDTNSGNALAKGRVAGSYDSSGPHLRPAGLVASKGRPPWSAMRSASRAPPRTDRQSGSARFGRNRGHRCMRGGWRPFREGPEQHVPSCTGTVSATRHTALGIFGDFLEQVRR